jgi:hypothetical protein
LRFPVPSTASPARAPCEAGRHLRLGSALRLSQPLSGFLASASFVALFHATASSWDPPFRVFPSQRARTPLGATCSPAVIHQRSEVAPLEALSLPVFPTPTPSRSCLVPPRTMGSLSANRVLASRLPWVSNGEAASSRQLHLLRSFLPPASPFVLRPGCPEQSSRYSPRFPPL